MVSAFVHDPPYLKRGFERVDWAGIALLTVGLTTLQLVLERGQSFGWFASKWIVTGTIVAVFTIAALLIWELASKEPVINFRLLHNVRLSVGSGLGAVIGFALFGSTFLLPQMTQEVLGYPAFRAGLVLFPRAASMFLIMPLVGRLYNYVSPRILIGFGMIMLAISFWQLGNILVTVRFSGFIAPLIETGIGIGCSMVLLSTISLSSLPRADMTAAAGIYTLIRRVSGNVSYAVLATLVERRTDFYRPLSIAPGTSGPASIFGIFNHQARMLAYTDCYKMLAWLFVLALPLIVLLPRRGVPATARSIAE
jgi:MFS transporter, DHA2 family, multidrug resistance protein